MLHKNIYKYFNLNDCNSNQLDILYKLIIIE